MAVVIKTEGLTKVYKIPLGGERIAVKDLNLEVYEGEIFGFLGPNGSGKTTTIKILLGLTFPTSGSAQVFGQDPRNAEVKQKIGYLPEMPYFYDFLTAKELLDFYGKVFGMSREERQRKIDELLQLVNMTEAKDLQIAKFSKGMLQRIGVAQALLNDPELLFLDEPTLGLDPIGAKEMKDLMLELKAKGKTLFYCTHMLSEAEAVCDRVGIINEGKLIKVGKLEELLTLGQEMELVATNLKEEAVKEIAKLGLQPTKRDEKIFVYHRDVDLLWKAVEVIRNHKGNLVSFSHRRETLEEFFVRTVREG